MPQFTRCGSKTSAFELQFCISGVGDYHRQHLLMNIDPCNVVCGFHAVLLARSGERTKNLTRTVTCYRVQVHFDGVAAPLLYAGPNQINAVVPSELAGHTSTTVNIVTPTGQIAGIVLSVTPSIPEVVTCPPPGNAALALNEDGTPNSATNPAAQGSVVSVWATGGGATGNPEADGAITGSTVYPLQLPLSVGTGFPDLGPIAPVLNPIPTPQVQYSGDAPDMVKGVIQVNFQIPRWSTIFATWLSGSPCRLTRRAIS